MLPFQRIDLCAPTPNRVQSQHLVSDHGTTLNYRNKTPQQSCLFSTFRRICPHFSLAANQKIICQSTMCDNVCSSEFVICKSWFPLLVISVSNKPWIGPVQILGQPFGLKNDSFGLECGHTGEQLWWFVCFDPLLSTACRLEDFPRDYIYHEK